MVSSAVALATTENVQQLQPASKPVQVMAVTGGKGGVGKSNIAINIALELGRLGQSVLVLDADLSLANIDVLCGVKSNGTLEDVFEARATLDDVLVQVGPNVSLLPANSGASNMSSLSDAQYGGLIHGFSSLQNPIDTMIIDTPAGISNQVTAFCCAAREVLVVVCDEPTSITDAYAVIKVLNTEHRVKHVNIVVNKSSSSQQASDLFEKILRVADKNLDVVLRYLGSVPSDEHLQLGVCKQNPVVLSYPGSRSALAFQKLAKKIQGWPEPKQPLGHVEFFVERLISQSTCAGVSE